MGIPIDDEVLYTLLFADDQVLLATDRDDISYMLRKLKEEYNKWGLTINTLKTEYMIAGYENDKGDLHLENEVIKYSPSFKHLGVTLSSSGRSSEDIENKIRQGKRANRQLNSVQWSKNINQTTKTRLYKTIVQSISTY